MKVKPTLQLLEHPDVFAAGDIIEWDEQKTAAKASTGHAPVIVKNVIGVLDGKKTLPGKYEGSTEMIIVTNGKGAGVGYMGFFGGMTLGAFAAKNIKSKTLMLGMIRGGFGY